MQDRLKSALISSLADPGEGPGEPPPLIFRPNWGLKGQKEFFGDRASPPFISRSVSGTAPNIELFMT